MTRRLRILFGVALPALAVCLSAHARGPSEEDDEPQRRRKATAAHDDVLRLADSLDRDEDEIEKQAHAIADKHNLESVMWLFKPRHKGGDGVEATLLALEKRALTPKELEAQRDDLIGMAKATFAASRAAPLYASRYVSADNGRAGKTWARYCEDMKDSSQDLLGALRADDVKALKKAVVALNRSCTNCHTTDLSRR